MKQLYQNISNVDVLAIGECSHGVHEFFTLKIDIMSELVRQHGFRCVAMETNFGDALVINDYVLGRTDDLNAAIAALRFRCWRVAEMQDALKWIRDFNDGVSESDKVHFFGFDMMFGKAPTQHLARHFESEKPHLDEISRREKEIAQQCARTAWQLLEMRLHFDDVSLRDTFMAENVIWIQKHISKKVILFAHNCHISKRSVGVGDVLWLPKEQAQVLNFIPMGHHLKKALGEAYFSVGATALQGTFSATKHSSDGTWGAGQFVLGKPREKSLESWCSDRFQKQVFLNSDSLPDENLNTRLIPESIFPETEIEACLVACNPRRDFDAIVFYPEVSAAHPIV